MILNPNQYMKDYFQKNKDKIQEQRRIRALVKTRIEIDRKADRGIITPFAYNMIKKFRSD